MIKINSEVFNVERFPNGELKLPILNSKNTNKKTKIDRMHKASLFKLKYIDYFSPNL